MPYALRRRFGAVTMGRPVDWILDQVVLFARGYGVAADDARILHHYNSTVVLLPDANLVVKVSDGAAAFQRAQVSQDVCSWLVEAHGFPATVPAPGLAPVVLADEMTASFWRYHPPAVMPAPPSSADLAGLLRNLHTFETPPLGLPAWLPLSSLESAIGPALASGVLTRKDHDWLGGRIVEIRRALGECQWSLGVGLIHGDAWSGNVLAEHQHGTAPRLRLADWDNTSLGPREVDLIPTWHASYRYGKGPEWRAAFQRIYGHDLRAWEGFPLLMQMRDLVQLSGPMRRAAAGGQYARALAQRLGDITAGAHHTTWKAL